MERNLKRLTENVFDVLIIGGGIYGVCVAWDAILRGLSVALVEKGDFGHATSSNTLRIIHGGLRYLQHGDIYRVRQSMLERMAFMRIAPHLVHPFPILIPTYGHFLRGKEALSLALLMNDLICFDRNCLEDTEKYIPHGRIISREECLQIFPGFEKKELTGGAIFYDCQMYSSERLLISFIRSAANKGAEMTNYTEVIGLLQEKNSVTGARIRDVLTGEELEIRAKMIVNASGPWLHKIFGFINGSYGNHRFALSKAFNLLLNRQLIPRYAIGVYGRERHEDQDALLKKGYRLFFIAPWLGSSLIGTVHVPYSGDPNNFTLSEKEIQSFLDEVNEICPTFDLKHEDISFVYGGLLPMSTKSKDLRDVQLDKQYQIFDHQKEDEIDGLISVKGVKFTEARHVAERVVNLVFRKIGKTPPKSMTAVTPIYGGQIERFNDYLTRETQRRPQGLSVEMFHRLIYGYGSEYQGVLKYINKSYTTSQTIIDESDLLKAEVLHGVREEMARKLADVIFRRTNLGSSGFPGDTCLGICASVMAEALGWDQHRIDDETKEVKDTFLKGTVYV